MIKAIIFDCFGVLTTDFWKEFVATLPPEQVEIARSLNYQYDSAQISLETFMSEVEKATGRNDLELVEKLGQEKNTELLDYIKQLGPKYKIGMLSNIGTNWITEEFLSDEEQGLFESMIFSHEVKMAKPDPEIFELAAKDLAVDIDECVFIDDSAGHIHAAKALGMKTIHYRNFIQMKSELESLTNSKS